MARRYQIQGPEQEAALRPVASPVDTFAPAIVQGPGLMDIYDLAPLSKGFGDLAAAIAQGVGEEAYKTGGDVFTQQKSEIQSAFQGGEKSAADKLAALARANKIPEHYIPQFYRGIYELGARDLLRSYQTDLKNSTDSLLNVEDAQGNLLPEPEKSADQVASEVWSKYAQNPVFSNYYGNREAAKYKTDLEADWKAETSNRRAEKLKAWRTRKLGEEVASLVSMAGSSDPEISNKGKEYFNAAMEQARSLGVPNIQEFVLNSTSTAVRAKVSAANLEPDPNKKEQMYEEARQMLLAVSETQFGQAKLGDSVVNSAIISEEFERIEANSTRERQQSLGLREIALRDAGWEWFGEVPPMLNDQGRFEWARNTALEKYPHDPQMQSQALRHFSDTEALRASVKISDRDAVDSVQTLLASGQTLAAEESLIQFIQTGKLSGQDALALRKEINAVSSGKKALSDSPQYAKLVADLGRTYNRLSAEIADFPGKDGLIASLESDKLELSVRATELVQSTNDPVKLREGFEALFTEYATKQKDWETNFNNKRDNARSFLDAWAKGEKSLTPTQLASLSSFVSSAEFYQFKTLKSNTEAVPRSVLEGKNDISALNRRINYAFSSALVGRADEEITQVSDDPELSALYIEINEAADAAAKEVWFKDIKTGRPEQDIIQSMAAEMRTAVFKAISESNASEETKRSIRAGLLNNKSAEAKKKAAVSASKLSNVAVEDIKAINANDGEIPEELQTIKSTHISPNGVISSVDAESFYETINEVLENSRDIDWWDEYRPYATWGRLGWSLRYPEKPGEWFNTSKSKREFVVPITFDYVIENRSSVVNDTYSTWKSAFKSDSDSAQAFVSEIYKNFGLTRNEAISKRIDSTDFDPSLQKIKFSTSGINPFYTPLFLDVMSGFDSVEDKKTVYADRALEAYFSEAETNLTYAKEVSAVMKASGLDDTNLSTKKLFITSQIEASRRVMQSYYAKTDGHYIQYLRAATQEELKAYNANKAK